MRRSRGWADESGGRRHGWFASGVAPRCHPRAAGCAGDVRSGLQPEDRIMNATRHLSRLAAAALAVSCLMLGGCREHNEPVKPIADLSAAPAAAPIAIAPAAT